MFILENYFFLIFNPVAIKLAPKAYRSSGANPPVLGSSGAASGTSSTISSIGSSSISSSITSSSSIDSSSITSSSFSGSKLFSGCSSFCSSSTTSCSSCWISGGIFHYLRILVEHWMTNLKMLIP